MQDRDEHAAGTRINETGLIPLDSLERSEIETAPAAPPYRKEPLFNKKVMAVWAIGAFAVWFGVTVVLPVVVAEVKTVVRERLKEAETNSAGTLRIIRDKEGRIITITKEPVTITTPAPPAPVQAPQPAKPPDAKK